MGATLAKPCLSTIVERKSEKSNGFRVGVAEMNGWRNKMEDAHVIHIRDDWAFFGVFDGHGGDQCSAFVAEKFHERLEADGCPVDDAAVKKLVLDIDAEFLETGKPSGTTGAMCIVHTPQEPGGKLRLRVVNVGDSRVFLGKTDGTIVDGGGTEQGLSTDHKPNHPKEKERIYRCGGTVEEAEGGVARVNGDLAVSRGFGDADYKKTGGPGPEDRPVTADPELGDFECDEDDFLIIACDGVSEGDFPNPEVVKLIAEHLKNSSGYAGGAGDPGSAAREVILMAEKKNSKDNITCMIIQFKGATESLAEKVDFVPGAIHADSKFLSAYQAMAKRADFTQAQALELRYNNICKALNDDESEQDKQALRDERKIFLDQSYVEEHKTGSIRTGTDESPQLSEAFFERLATELGKGDGETSGGLASADIIRMLSHVQFNQQFSIPTICQGKVRIAEIDKLKGEVERHSALQWDEKMTEICGVVADVRKKDPSDQTVQVEYKGIVAWLPDNCVTDLEGDDDGPSAEASADKDRGGGGYGAGAAL